MFLYEKKQLMNCLVGISWGFCLPCFPCDLEKTFWHQVHLVSCMFQIVLESSSIDYYFYVLFNYLKTQMIVFVFHFSLYGLFLWLILTIFRSKRLWLDGFLKLSSVLTLKELSDLQEVMRDKELNIRTDIYEILLQDETDTWLNVSLVRIKNSRTSSHDIVGNHYLPRFQQRLVSHCSVQDGCSVQWSACLWIDHLAKYDHVLVFLPSIWTLLLVTPVIWCDTFLLEVQKGLHWTLDKMDLER
jgi:hypothetical protein